MFWYSFYSEDRRRMAKRSGTTVTRGQRRFQLFSGGRGDAGGYIADLFWLGNALFGQRIFQLCQFRTE